LLYGDTIFFNTKCLHIQNPGSEDSLLATKLYQGFEGKHDRNHKLWKI